MEFSKHLTRIQGALVTLNRANGLRKHETGVKGGTGKNSALYDSLEKVLSEFKDNELEMRKAHLYLIFNSDFSFNEEVANEDDFCHIVSSAPTIDKYLLVETILLLKLDKFIYETIVFGHIVVSLEYLEVLLSALSSKKPLSDTFAVENILLAVNKRLVCVEREMEVEHQELEKARRKLSFYFHGFLSLFAPPHRENEMGYIIKSLLSLLQSCLCHKSFDAEIDEKYNIYSLSLSDYSIKTKTKDYLDLEKREDILCLIDVLKSNLNLINLSTWISWSECEWEAPADVEECSRTIQQVIGEQAFLCRQELQRFCNDMPEAVTLSTVLTNMEIKPITDEDEIEKAEDISQIISKVMESNRSPESKKKWLMALFKFSWHSKEEECVSCLQELGNLLDSFEGIHKLQKKVGEVLSGISACQTPEQSNSNSRMGEVGEISEPLKDKMRILVFEAYPWVSIENQGKLVGAFYKEFGWINCFHVDGFEKRVTEIFNKAVNVKETKGKLLSDICVLCLQSPVEIVHRLLVLGIGCDTQIPFVVEVIKVISVICQLHYVGELSSTQVVRHEPPGSEATLLCHQLSLLMKQNNWNETEISNLLIMIVQCLESSVLLHEHLLDHCVIPGLEECMKNSSWNSINKYIEILNTCLTMPSCSLSKISNPAAILAYILFILEKGRCDMRKNFSVAAASTCELIISYMPVLLEKFLDQGTLKEEDMYWLRKRVLSSSLQCHYYYHKLWCDPTNAVPKNFQSLILLGVYNEPEFDEKKMMDLLTTGHSLLSFFLFKLLPSCTTSEWINVTSALKSVIPKATEEEENLCWNLLHLISNVLLVMIIAAKNKYIPGDNNVLYCIELWFKSYQRIIREEFYPLSKYFNNAQSADLFKTIIRILEEVPENESIRETCSFLALNVLIEIIEAVLSENCESKDVASENPDIMKLFTCITLMSEGESKKGLARKVVEILYK